MGRVLAMGILWLWVWITMAEAEYMRYKDPKQPTAARVKDLLKRMTLEEKIGQMVQIDRLDASFDIMKTYSIGIFLFLLIVLMPLQIFLIKFNNFWLFVKFLKSFGVYV